MKTTTFRERVAISIVFNIAVGVPCALFGYSTGHDNGVRDHAAGRYVVVPLPDGTEQVCKVKEKTDGK